MFFLLLKTFLSFKKIAFIENGRWIAFCNFNFNSNMTKNCRMEHKLNLESLTLYWLTMPYRKRQRRQTKQFPRDTFVSAVEFLCVFNQRSKWKPTDKEFRWLEKERSSKNLNSFARQRSQTSKEFQFNKQ